jgi:polyhydroxybutyrate depolymerase
MMHLLLAGLALLVVLVALTALYFLYSPAPKPPQLKGSLTKEVLDVKGRSRTYQAYIPRSLPFGAPLVIVLHGTGQTGGAIRKWTNSEFDALADRNQFAVAYPDGYKGGWNDCRREGVTPSKKENIDDVAFISAIIRELESKVGIASNRLYLFGFSNGGQMSFRLIAQLPGRFSGVVLVGAQLPTPENMLCTFTAVPPVALFAGTKDPIVPYSGGKVSFFGFKSFGNVLSAQDTAIALARLHGEDTIPAEVSTQGESRRQSWSLDARVVVRLVTIERGGHTVPQPGFRYPRIMGRTSQTINVPVETVQFFGIGQ